MAKRRTLIDDPLYAYLHEFGVRESEAARGLRAATRSVEMAGMQISPLQAGFLSMLAASIGARRCIEVGVFTGYSALAVAAVLPEDGILIACDVSEEWTAIGRPFWAAAGVADRIDLRLAPATATLEALLADGGAGTFDFAFIDADKENYEVYFELCLRLMRSGGLIAVDNVLWGGAVLHPEDASTSTRAIIAFNETRRVDERVDLSMVPIGDGVTLLRKR
jgi:predicted O-methyltransferase YrrM